jgi:hypothetical protein
VKQPVKGEDQSAAKVGWQVAEWRQTGRARGFATKGIHLRPWSADCPADRSFQPKEVKWIFSSNSEKEARPTLSTG